MVAVTRRRAPLLALSGLTGVTGIRLGGCLAVRTLGFVCPPPPLLPYGDLAQLRSPRIEALCRHFLTIYVLVPQAGACPALKPYPWPI